MQAVVKKPHIRLEGEIPAELLAFLRDHYADVEIIENEDDELEDVFESTWYKNIRAETTPGDNLRIYREIHGMTQEQLGEKLGGIPRQGISNMENGHRAISKKTAKKLAEIFDVSVEKFI